MVKNINEAPIKRGVKVFVASDLDVPLNSGVIMDTYRLDCMLPSLKYIVEKEGFPIIGGHIGRPKGKVVEDLSTKTLKPYFDRYLGPGNYELLENLRFDPREESAPEEFAKELASKADIYVNEVFSTSHREESYITGVPKHLPSYAGIRLAKEIETLSGLLQYFARPFVVVIGGAKIEDKKPVVNRFLELADTVLLGGKVALDWNEKVPNNLQLPNDYASEFKDIGPSTITRYKHEIETARTVLWAGPMGAYEEPMYFDGSKAVAESITKITQLGAYTVAGGGDTAEILRSLNLRDKLSFLSTGGGAMLEYLVNGTLPGLEALDAQR